MLLFVTGWGEGSERLALRLCCRLHYIIRNRSRSCTCLSFASRPLVGFKQRGWLPTGAGANTAELNMSWCMGHGLVRWLPSLSQATSASDGNTWLSAADYSTQDSRHERHVT